MMADLLIVGVDPAAGKKKRSYVFAPDEKPPIDCPVDLECLRNLIKRWEGQRDVLVCWDSPLTGPTLPPPSHGSLASRPLEETLSRELDDAARSRGVNVLPFACVSHWVISRHLLGLPRVGCFDLARNLPLRWVSRRDEVGQGVACVVEVHPTLALWRWLGVMIPQFPPDNSASPGAGASCCPGPAS